MLEPTPNVPVRKSVWRLTRKDSVTDIYVSKPLTELLRSIINKGNINKWVLWPFTDASQRCLGNLGPILPENGLEVNSGVENGLQYYHRTQRTKVTVVRWVCIGYRKFTRLIRGKGLDHQIPGRQNIWAVPKMEEKIISRDLDSGTSPDFWENPCH